MTAHTAMSDSNPPVLGQPLPPRMHRADTVQLFLYNAAIWNPHRIHYDLPYTQAREGHPALLIDGPLQGDWLLQAVYARLDSHGGELLSFRFSNRRAAYVGETLRVEGEVSAVDDSVVTYALRAVNGQGQVTTTGEARVRYA